MNDLSTVVVYSASLVLPVTAPALPGGSVAVYQGRVVHVGTRSWVLEALSEGPLRAHRIVDIILMVFFAWFSQRPYAFAIHRYGFCGEGTYNNFQEWSDAFDTIYDDDSLHKPWRQWAHEEHVSSCVMVRRLPQILLLI